MLCIIANYNLDVQARALRDSFSPHCETLVVDSSGTAKGGFMPVGSYQNFQRSCELFITSKHERCLFICSDVQVYSPGAMTAAIDSLPNNIGIYTPALSGKCHEFLRYEDSSIKHIPFAEGMILCANRAVIAEYLKRDVTNKTHLGWGLDAYKGFICKQLGYGCVKDGRFLAHHPEARSYSTKAGERALKKFINLMGKEFERFCNDAGLGLPLYKICYRRLTGNYKKYTYK